MTVEETLQDAEQKMQGAVSVAHDELGSASAPAGRTRSSSTGSRWSTTGPRPPLNQLASFSVPEPRLLVIQPFDKNAMARDGEGDHASDLGLTPSNDGNVIRLAFPPLTEERRRDLIKHRARAGRGGPGGGPERPASREGHARAA